MGLFYNQSCEFRIKFCIIDLRIYQNIVQSRGRKTNSVPHTDPLITGINAGKAPLSNLSSLQRSDKISNRLNSLLFHNTNGLGTDHGNIRFSFQVIHVSLILDPEAH